MVEFSEGANISVFLADAHRTRGQLLQEDNHLRPCYEARQGLRCRPKITSTMLIVLLVEGRVLQQCRRCPPTRNTLVTPSASSTSTTMALLHVQAHSTMATDVDLHPSQLYMFDHLRKQHFHCTGGRDPPPWSYDYGHA